MLKKLRIVVCVLVFLDFLMAFSGGLQGNESFVRILSHSQLVPSVMNFVSRGSISCLLVIGLIILSAALLGRIYCSSICPMGILQDLFIYLRLKFRRKSPLQFRDDTASRRYLRYGSALLVFVSIVGGVSLVVALLDPYSLFGKIVTGSLIPAFAWAFNKVGFFARGYGYYGLPLIHVQHISSLMLTLGTALLLGFALLSFSRGRWFCNYLCPAGALLGVFSKRTIVKISLDSSACTSCGICEKTCKGECISSEAKTVDNERCVRCFNCLDVCSFKAVSYRKRVPVSVKGVSPVGAEAVTSSGIQRRGFIKSWFVVLSAITAYALSMKNLLATKIKGIPVIKKNPVVIPPGAKSLQHFNESCTSCGICSANCPTSVISVTTEGTGGLSNAMKPVLDYNHNYCLSECNSCSLVCPTGAIEPVSLDDKKLLQLGEVQLIKENCLAWMDHEYCTVCEEYCPTKAVYAIKHPDVDIPGHTVPAIDTKRCIGCGACEFMCPAQPAKAIYIEGKKVHSKALPPLSEEDIFRSGDSETYQSRGVKSEATASGKTIGQKGSLEEFPF